MLSTSCPAGLDIFRDYTSSAGPMDRTGSGSGSGGVGAAGGGGRSQRIKQYTCSSSTSASASASTDSSPLAVAAAAPAGRAHCLGRAVMDIQASPHYPELFLVAYGAATAGAAAAAYSRTGGAGAGAGAGRNSGEQYDPVVAVTSGCDLESGAPG